VTCLAATVGCLSEKSLSHKQRSQEFWDVEHDGSGRVTAYSSTAHSSSEPLKTSDITYFGHAASKLTPQSFYSRDR
jgi:hypothetical protein